MHPSVKTGIKGAITAANRPMAVRRLRRLLASSEAPFRIELGTATFPHHGFIPTDRSWRARYWLDATKPWPVPPLSVSHVFGDNVIEHLSLPAARALLRHAHRAMAPGARMRLVTPDVEAFVRMYSERGSLLRQFRDQSRQEGLFAEHDVRLLSSVFVDHGHSSGYLWDFDALTTEVARAGFTGIERCAVGVSDDPVLSGLDRRAGPVDDLLYLAVEAVRA